MNNKSVLILGVGHIAERTIKILSSQNFKVVHYPDLFSDILADKTSTIKKAQHILRDLQMASFDMTYILYDEDKDNLEMVITITSLYPDLPIATSLFNENILPHLEKANPHLKVINPAKIASAAFIQPLGQLNKNKPFAQINSAVIAPIKNHKDAFLIQLITSFTILLCASVSYFHYNDQLSWLDALYFVVVTMTTVGYGDINLQSASDLSKVVGMVLILCSSIFIWLIFSLMIDGIIKKRAQLQLGRKRYKYKDHVIICGLGRLGFFIAKELYEKGEKIIIIEANSESSNIEYFRGKNIDIYIGNASLPTVLKDVGAENCRALISVINDDYTNLEIGLNAKHFQADIKLVLRIFDETMALIIKDKFNIHLTHSMSFIAAEKFASLLNTKEPQQ
jgi:voltage-gated potassium channel Kch